MCGLYLCKEDLIRCVSNVSGWKLRCNKICLTLKRKNYTTPGGEVEILVGTYTTLYHTHIHTHTYYSILLSIVPGSGAHRHPYRGGGSVQHPTLRMLHLEGLSSSFQDDTFLNLSLLWTPHPCSQCFPHLCPRTLLSSLYLTQCHVQHG